MSEKEPEEENTLVKVARTVGSALGTVASKAGEVVGTRSDDAAPTPERKGKKGKKVMATPDLQLKAREKKKSKRAKHKRKLGRRTGG